MNRREFLGAMAVPPLVLSGSKGKPLPFLMYPQAEIAGTRLDSLDPDRFKYTITAREV